MPLCVMHVCMCMFNKQDVTVLQISSCFLLISISAVSVGRISPLPPPAAREGRLPLPAAPRLVQIFTNIYTP